MSFLAGISATWQHWAAPHSPEFNCFSSPPHPPVCVWCVSCSAAVPARRPDLFNAGRAGTARRAGSYWSPFPLLRLLEENEVMSVRYTATWYDVTQARQQDTHHTHRNVPARPAGLQDSVPSLPGGRNSGQKAQKGPQKKNLWPNFG